MKYSKIDYLGTLMYTMFAGLFMCICIAGTVIVSSLSYKLGITNTFMLATLFVIIGLISFKSYNEGHKELALMK